MSVSIQEGKLNSREPYFDGNKTHFLGQLAPSKYDGGFDVRDLGLSIPQEELENVFRDKRLESICKASQIIHIPNHLIQRGVDNLNSIEINPVSERKCS